MALRFWHRFPRAKQRTAFLKIILQTARVTGVTSKQLQSTTKWNLAEQIQDYSPGRYNCTSLTECSTWELVLHVLMRETHTLWEDTGIFLMICTTSFKAWGCRHQGASLKNGRKSKSAHVPAPYSNNAETEGDGTASLSRHGGGAELSLQLPHEGE